MVATDLQKGLAVAMTTNLGQPQKVAIPLMYFFTWWYDYYIIFNEHDIGLSLNYLCVVKLVIEHVWRMTCSWPTTIIFANSHKLDLQQVSQLR